MLVITPQTRDRLVEFLKKEETIPLQSKKLHLKKQPLHFKKAQQNDREIKAWYEISPIN